MNHKLIVFDWNGTVLADTQASLDAGNVTLEFFGAPVLTMAQYREAFTFPIIHFYKKLGVSVDLVLERKKEANALFQATYQKFSKNSRTRRGARGLLQWIKDQGMTAIILSNHRVPDIKVHLKRLKLEDYFQHVSAHDCDGTTILTSTTKTERLSSYMVKRGYKPEDTIIIGDSAEEPAIARQLGLTSIGITDGYISRARLREAAPDYIVNDFSAVQSIIEAL